MSAVVFGAPFSASHSFLKSLPFSTPVSAVYHGPTTFVPLPFDPYSAAKALGIYYEIGEHGSQDINAGTIVRRIMAGRAAFEERQKRKGAKAVGEEEVRRREQMEAEALEKEKAAKQAA